MPHRRTVLVKKEKKFSAPTPEGKLEISELHGAQRHKQGIISEKQAVVSAPTSATGSYVQEYYDATGNLVKFMGAYIPLYITPEILDYEFNEF